MECVMRQTWRLFIWYTVILFLNALFVGIFGIANGVTIKTINMDASDLLNNHRVHVKSLNLWTWSDYYEVAVKGLESFNISDWLVVWRENTKSNGWLNVAVGWWTKNEVKWNSVWIVWGNSNKITIGEQNNAVIGGWLSNTSNWGESVIWWGRSNIIKEGGGWIILGWYQNSAYMDNVVLWWFKNQSFWTNSWILWNNAKASLSSFSWNDGQEIQMIWESGKNANIRASAGILIWTYDVLTWVNLVVNGAVQIWDSSTSWVGWEVKMVNGCLYAYDGNHWHVLGKNSEVAWNCNTINTGDVCKFGKVELQAWDRVIAYSQPYAVNCNKNTIAQTVTCSGWVLLTNGWDTKYTYPSCYTVSSTPTLWI